MNPIQSVSTPFLLRVFILSNVIIGLFFRPAFAATFTVVNTNVTGAGSLQQAIFDANTNAGADTIAFNIASGGLTISLNNALPVIVEPVTIDGATQPGFVSAPVIELNGTSAGAAVDGLKITTSNCVIRSLVINRFLGDGIEIATNGFNTIAGCYIGLNLTGVTDLGNTLNGILVTNSGNNTIGGLNATSRNYISGNNQSGINFGGVSATNNAVLGNFIGLNVTNGAIANSVDGIRLNAPLNTIGGSASGSRNVISGNTGDGIEITTLGTNSVVRGNYIGTDSGGTLDRGNTLDGILISARNVTIGGSAAGDGNLISGNNSEGIQIDGTNVVVLGNFIGTDFTGASGVANTSHGVLVNTTSRSNIVGGITAGEANVIAFNTQDGISVAANANATNHTFRGNSIFSNGDFGIDLANNDITANDAGDTDTGANNLQNFPVLTAATNTPSGTIVSGSLNSRANTAYVLDFYTSVAPDPSGSGEGQTYIGSTNLATDGAGITNFTILLPVVTLQGRYISATATDDFGNTSEFATNVLAVSTAPGITFTVLNTNNSGAGSLRQAIIDANATITAGDTITFAITNLTTTISPASVLPTIIDPVTIDGYTQPGAVVNTSASVFNAVLPVRLSGASAGGDGLLITAGNSTVRGLMITGFTSDGIEISGFGANTIEGNVIGLDAAGTDQGNTANGVFINGSSNNIVGGTALAARNILSGNNSDGVEISGALAQNNQVINNLIGTEQTGTLDRGNTGDGVFVTLAGANTVGGASAGSGNLISGNNDNGIELSGVSTTNTVVFGNIIGATFAGDFDLPNSGHGVFITTSSRSNTIGGVLPGQANQISFNFGDGINVATATANTNNSFRGNSIYSNGNLGIDLGANGTQINDAGDPDTGANQLQNFPIITTVTNSATDVIISGTLNSRPNVTYTLDFYSSITVDATGVGEGQAWIGGTNLTTAADSNLAFTVSFAVTNLTGRYITATATDDFGNTSEFGTNVAAVSTAPGQIFTVRNTNDIGPGSLRQAIIDANLAITVGDTIVFAITNLSTTIRPGSFLPPIIDSVTIDGTTQAGAVANTSSAGFNGVLPVVLDGISAIGSADGLRFFVGGNTVRGLNIINFNQDGLDFGGGGSNTVAGCIIGLDAASVDRGNAGNGILLTGSANNVIGGTTLAARNVISGNGGDGVEINGITSSNNMVIGNLIGTDLTGLLDRGNNSEGVLVNGAPFNTIGGTNTVTRNVISGNNNNGVLIQGTGATNNLVLGNYIGTQVNGLSALGNSGDGVLINNLPGNTVGWGTPGAGNVISGNSSDGVVISGASAIGNVVEGNRIGTDVNGAVDLGNSANGVFITAAPGNLITNNLISGNNGDGVEISGSTAGTNVIKNNLIGINATGTAGLGNTGHGIFITSSAHHNVIGGSGNTIAYSGLDGIYIASGGSNTLRHNLIFNNGGLGIDLGTDGVTTNDPNDADTGANLLQNYPVLSAATNSLAGVNIAGALDSAASTSYDLDFFVSVAGDASGFGEGQVYLGSTNVTTDGSGHVSFQISFPTVLTSRYVTATATDPGGNISEFSPWLVAASTIAPTNIVVTTTNDSGAGSLREAIQIVNSFISSGNDTISFNLGGAGPFTIYPTNPLPDIVDAVTIDGYTQSGASINTACTSNNAVILLRLVGLFAPDDTDGLRLTGSGNSIVRGLAIVGFTGDGIEIVSGTNHQVTGCFIGIEPDGNLLAGNTIMGVYINGPATSANRIGGDEPAERNLISGNGDGVWIQNSPRNIVSGNLIGTDRTGTLKRGNELSGVVVNGALTPGDVAVSNVIGGFTACERNVISGNGQFQFSEQHGIDIWAANNTQVIGNYIGLDATGTQPLGNASSGVRVAFSRQIIIGGSTAAERNIISANSYGVHLQLSSSSNTVSGNYIGTDATGALDRGNSLYGVILAGASYGVINSNVVSGNDNDAVYVAGNSSPGNRITANLIGVAANGTNALGNLGTGVRIEQSDTQIGSTNNGDGNVIAFNSGRGVTISTSNLRCPILGNSIYSNSNLGIDLNVNGVSGNDAGDADSGANNLQNFPVLQFALSDTNTTWAIGSLDSRTNQTYRIEFFDNTELDLTGFGEGRRFFAVTNITTDASGHAGFLVYFNPPPIGNFVTATATDTNGNTSEFSAGAKIVPFDSIDLTVATSDSTDPASAVLGFSYSITVTNRGPINATGVILTDALPPGINFVSASSSQGTVTNFGGVVTCSLGTLDYTSNAMVTINVTGTQTGLVTNTVTATANEFDHTSTNNTDSETTFVGIADLAVRITDSPDPVIAGQLLTNVITVTNLGPDAATSVNVSFDLADNAVPVSSSVSQGSVLQFGNSFSYNAGTIPPGNSATLTVTGIPTESGLITHYGNVFHAGTDPVFGNNNTNASTTVTDGAGVLRFISASFGVAEDSGLAFISVLRTGGAISAVSASFLTSNGSASAGMDYSNTVGTLFFTNGETIKTFTVPIINDTAFECNEFFNVSLHSPTGGLVLIGTTQAVVNLIENDLNPGGNVIVASGSTTYLAGSPGNDNSFKSSVSADGRYVVFSSYANNLAENDDNFAADVFMRDLLTQTTILVSRNQFGFNSGNGSSQNANISGNGRYVVFDSTAEDLVASDNNGQADVFVRDLLTGTTAVVSINAAGTNSGNNTSFVSSSPFHHSIVSSNGQGVVYLSTATDLTDIPDSNNDADIFLFDQMIGSNVLISVNMAGISAGSAGSFEPSISANGQVIAFLSRANDLVGLDSNGSDDVFVHDRAFGSNELVSVNLSGTDSGNEDSFDAYLSEDGRYVVFTSAATDLVTNSVTTQNAYWRDRMAGVTRLVSVRTNGNIGGNASSNVRGISANGRYVVFSSDASNLVPNDNNSREDIFVRDMVADTTVLVSVNLSGTGPGNNSSIYPVISADGTHVAFESFATDLTPASKVSFYSDIFVRDLVGGVTRLVSFRDGSTNGGNYSAYDAAINFNGNVTSFTSDPEDGGGKELAPASGGGGGGNTDIWAHTFASNVTELVSGSTPSKTGNGFSYDPAVSRDGLWAAFASTSGNLMTNDANNTDDVFVMNLTTYAIELLSANSGGAAGNDYSSNPSISSNGNYVAFESFANDLVTGDNNFTQDIFVRDRLHGTNILVSANLAGTAAANSYSATAAISADGRYVVFASSATDVAGITDANNATDIFLRDLMTGTTTLISRNMAGTGSASGNSFVPVIEVNPVSGNVYVAYLSYADDLVNNDTNNNQDVFLYDVAAGSNHLVSVNFNGNGSGNEYSLNPQLGVDSVSGNVFVTYSSYATNLVNNDANGWEDVFVFDLLSQSNKLASVNQAGTGSGNDYSTSPSISANGRYVAFQSSAADLIGGDTNGQSDIFLRDLVAGTTVLVTGNCEGTASANGYSYAPVISTDGRYVSYLSSATDLLPGFFNGADNVFRYDRVLDTSTVISQNRFLNGGGNNSSYDNRISANGGAVAFTSSASDLVAGDANTDQDVFVWQAGAVVTSVDLVMDKTASTALVGEFFNFNYTLAVTNFGTLATSGVAVTDTLPAGVSFVSAITTQGTVTNSGNTVTANIGGLINGAGARVTITVTATNAGVVNNTATAAAIESDATPGNNSDSVAVTITPLAPPPLTVTPTNTTQLLITWPASTPNVFAMETATNLAPVIVWATLTNSIFDNGTVKGVLINVNASESERFYRLKR